MICPACFLALEWRFMVDGHLYSHITDLVDTPRNRTAALRLEAPARQLVTAGREAELHVQVEPFNNAVDSFIALAKG